MAEYYVYIMANKSKTLYVGVTNDLARRVHEHKAKAVPGFTSHYNLTKLVYYETTNNVDSAIAREKQIKGWLRKKKIALVESMNKAWEDLSVEWDITKNETLRYTQSDTQLHCHSEGAKRRISSAAKARPCALCEETLRGVYPERDSSVASLLQNDSEGLRVTGRGRVTQEKMSKMILRAVRIEIH